MQSNPSIWLSVRRLRVALTTPICRTALVKLSRTAFSPAAWSARRPDPQPVLGVVDGRAGR